jgi:biopolymer transport protein ExbD
MSSFGGSSKEAISLNLNPMLDVFSILITFLLMSFSADPISHDINPGIELPESKTTVALDEIPSITVTKSKLLVNDKEISPIIGGDVPEKDRSQGAIYPLYLELVKMAETMARTAGRTTRDEKKKLGTVTLEMDKDHRFKLLKRVMLTGQQADFITFKLMVSKELN